MRRLLSSVAVGVASLATVAATQDPGTGAARYEVVSIKRNTVGGSGGMRTLPDGTLVMVNQPLRSLLGAASPLPADEIVGYPGWVTTERYDITAKPPEGTTREQRGEMIRNLFVDRMNLAGHMEERERTTYSLVLARGDGRLGPELTRSALDCGGKPPAPLTVGPPATTSRMLQRCGFLSTGTMIVSGGITMDQFAAQLRGTVGTRVTNATGLAGWYALTLHYTGPGPSPLSSTGAASPDDPPEIFTALQEQLGLKLQPGRSMVPIFVVDRIERPTEN